jgi:hypothetical protein
LALVRGGTALGRVVSTASLRGATAVLVLVGVLVGWVAGAQAASSAGILASTTPSPHGTLSATSTYGTVTATLAGSWAWDITNPRYLSAYETSSAESITFSESVTVRVPKCVLTPYPGCLNEASDKSSLTADVVGQPTMTIAFGVACPEFAYRALLTGCSPSFNRRKDEGGSTTA